MRKLSSLVVSVLLVFIVACVAPASESKEQSNHMPEETADSIKQNDTLFETGSFEDVYDTFGRGMIVQQLELKKAERHPLIVHVFVPLCDNEHQNIVPTSKSLGNGLNLKTNLYWAVGGSTKYDFVHSPQWETVYNKFDLDSNVLERIVFERDYPQAKVYVVADAYRGDRMEACLNDFWASVAQCKHDTVPLSPQSPLYCSAGADLFIFNGHNGMMDAPFIKDWRNTSTRKVDVVINACATYYYFNEELKKAGGYPLVRSTSLLHPGAYVLTQIIDDWQAGVPADTLCLNAGRAYCKVQNCGRGSKIYMSGW